MSELKTENLKTATLSVRMTPEEKEAIREEAWKNRMSMAEFVWMSLERSLGLSPKPSGSVERVVEPVVRRETPVSAPRIAVNPPRAAVIPANKGGKPR